MLLSRALLCANIPSSLKTKDGNWNENAWDKDSDGDEQEPPPLQAYSVYNALLQQHQTYNQTTSAA